MALLPTPTVDYTDKDFDSLRARVFNLIAAAFPDWTDQNVSNFGNVLVDAFCFIGDVLGFYLDNHARESRIVTAQQRRSLISLAKLLNYVPKGAAAATVDVQLTAAAVPAGDVLVAAGTVVRTLSASPIKFQTLADATLLAGTDPPVLTVTVENSESHSEAFASSGLPNQAIRLTATPYLDDSAEVSAGNGAYTQVSSLLSSGPDDRHYVVVIDNNDQAEIRFGNGVSGQQTSGTIAVNYKTGGGLNGNVEPETIRKVEGTFTDSLSNSVVFSALNALGASGGDARESVDEIRVNAPEQTRVLTRTVAREDYEINAKRLAGVARALMLTSDEWAVIPENQGFLYVVPSGGGTPTQALLDDVETICTETYPNTLTFKLSVLEPLYLTVDVQATLVFAKGANKSATVARIKANLAAYFNVDPATSDDQETVDFGFYYQDSAGVPTQELPYSDVYNVVRDTTGVRKIGATLGDFLLNGAQDDVAIALAEFPILGDVTIIDAETGVAVE